MITPNQDKRPVSLLLYIAGLCVTLSGLFALNYELEDANFSMLSYSLVIVGYVFSYFLRVRQISLHTVQVPLFISVVLLVLANISANGMGWLQPAGTGDHSALGLKMLIAWIAIIHAFLLTSDSSVLFACVPGMTLLALVSTINSANAIQNAFILFIGAATFMMVHENSLRTHPTVPTGKIVRRDRSLLRGQLQLTAVCLISSILLAHIIAVPIRSIGQSLFDPASFTTNNSAIPKPPLIAMPNLNVSEQNVLELAAGPTTETDTPLMRVRSDRGLNWRGTTFSKYTGTSFENPWYDKTLIQGVQEDNSSQSKKWNEFSDPAAATFTGSLQTYTIPASRDDLPVSDMLDSQQTQQQITIFSGVFSSLYGAASITQVKTIIPALYINSAGAILGSVPANTVYEVQSQVPTRNPELLRSASSKPEDVPKNIQENYLQLPEDKPADEALLQNQVEALLRGKKNNYDKVLTLKNFISEHCKYNLQSSRAPRGRDIVAWFLFDKREGYCDSFAAALTVLCRYAKIPARMASGFLTGDMEADGTYLVRQKHKHVWTEVFFPHIGWETFDATEGTIDISTHNNIVQRRTPDFGAWLTSHGLLPPILLTIFVILLGYVIQTELLGRLRPRSAVAQIELMRPQTNQQIAVVYSQTVRLLTKRGLPRLIQQTPDEYAAFVGRKTSEVMPPLTLELFRLTALYSRFSYGKDIATDADIKEAREAASSIQTMLQITSAKEFIAAHQAVSI